MKPFKRIVLLLTATITCQLLLYFLCVKPYMATWGAEDSAVSMTLPGDSLFPSIESTRCIEITAPSSRVWKTVAQFGADRGSFYSYEFLENLLGYEKNDSLSRDTSTAMYVGREIPATTKASGGLINYSFSILAVEQGKWVVVSNWGTVFLKPEGPNQTKLIVRTNGRETSGIIEKIENFITFPGHYIMERRMLIGMKAASEEIELKAVHDIMWFSGVILSAFFIFLMACSANNIQGYIQTIILGTCWLLPLYIGDAAASYSILFLFICAGFFLVSRILQRKKEKKAPQIQP